MGQFLEPKNKKPCLACGTPVAVRHTKEKPFCGRICRTLYGKKAKYFGGRSETINRPK